MLACTHTVHLALLINNWFILHLNKDRMSTDIHLPKTTHQIKMTALLSSQRTLFMLMLWALLVTEKHTGSVCILFVYKPNICHQLEACLIVKTNNRHEKVNSFWNTLHLVWAHGILSGTIEHVLCHQVCRAMPNIFYSLWTAKPL